MIISEKNYNAISNKVYWLDSKHKKYAPSMKQGAIRNFGGQEFEILEVKNNPDNGMQAMAVA